MQKYILSKKNLITLTGGILIALAYFAEFGFESAALAQGALAAKPVITYDIDGNREGASNRGWRYAILAGITG